MRSDLPSGFSWAALSSGAVKIQTLGEVLARYRIHPEHKSLGPDGRWADEVTVGLLRRRPVLSAPVLTDLIGKEGNKIIERLSGEAEGQNRRCANQTTIAAEPLGLT